MESVFCRFILLNLQISVEETLFVLYFYIAVKNTVESISKLFDEVHIPTFLQCEVTSHAV